MRNKRGAEMVEAAIVLPIILLVVFSLLLLMVYFYSALSVQVKLHRELTAEIAEGKGPYQKLQKTGDAEAEIGGLERILMHKRISARAYAFKEAEIIRMGEGIHED